MSLIPAGAGDLVEIPAQRWPAAVDVESGLVTLPALLEHLRHSLLRLSRQPRTLAVIATEVQELVQPGRSAEQRTELLSEVARRLTSAIRVGDIAGRIGRCTFGLLCEDLSSLDEAVQITERVIDALDAPMTAGHEELTIKARLGLGFPVGADHPDELMRRSLEALHAARLNPRLRYDVILGTREQPRPPFQ